MADNKCGASSENIWTEFIDNLQLVIDEIKDGEGKEDAAKGFDSVAYWKVLGDVFKAMSHEATKLSLAFSKLPCPSTEDCQGLVTSAQKTVLALVSVFNNLPKSAGLTLRKTVKTAVKQLFEDFKSLAEIIRASQSGGPDQLKSTGIVWSDCDRVSSLPHDNKEAVVQVVEANLPLLDDAVTELTDALNCNEDDDGLDDFLGIESHSSQNDHAWSEEDKNTIQYCLGLVKCSKSVLKRTKTALKENGRCESEEVVTQLDDVVDHIERLSPAVDELTSCVYPPLRSQVVRMKAEEMHKINKSMLEFLKHSHLTTEDDQKWIQFLMKANKHNFSKFKNCMPTT